MKLSEATFAVTDVETTGTSPDRHRLTEVACILVKNGEILSENSTLINPECYISRDIQRITGISNGMVASSPTASEIAPEVRSWFPSDSIFTAHNVQFDVRFLQSTFRRTNADPLESPTLCTLRLARRLMPMHRGFSLGRLARHLGVRISNRHRALGDARATARILGILLELAENQGIESIDQLTQRQHGRTAAFAERTEKTIRLAEEVRSYPDRPGVYRMLGRGDQLLYVGKAKSLKDRVGSYFRGRSDGSKRQAEMIRRVRRVEFVETGSELGAILLESRTIKEHQPKYNVAGKRLRRYSFVRIDRNSPFARPEVAYRVEPDGADYFGPLRNRDEGEMLVDAIQSAFPLRECEGEIRPDPDGSACLYLDLGRCNGPCIARETSEDYENHVRQVCNALNGSQEGIIRVLDGKMRRASELQEFEAAAEMRDRITEVERVFSLRRTIAESVDRNNLVVVVPGIPEGRVDCFLVRHGRLAAEIPTTGRFPEVKIRRAVERHYFGSKEIRPILEDPIDIDEIRLVSSYIRSVRSISRSIDLAQTSTVEIDRVISEIRDAVDSVRKSARST